jgi:plasmid replication initiation protein
VSNCSLVLSLHRDYFLLTGGIERWLYRFVRKGAGRNRGGWRWRMRTLHERSGTTQDFKYFAREVRSIASAGKLLDYKLQLVVDGGLNPPDSGGLARI